ncbi:MAG: autotransporter domain-containing protein, partial [Hyphomicrobium sp.]|nr:autotransporter domain-containing protein [Hyphomicrobium sp.]
CTINANQAGNGTFNAAPQVQQTVTINRIATTTEVSSSLNPSTFGANVTFTATVTSSAGPVTVGAFTFRVGGMPLASGVSVNASGQASFVVSNLPVGSHVIDVVYLGTPSFVSSTSSPVTQVVNKATQTISLSASPTSIPFAAGSISTLTLINNGPGSGAVTYSVSGPCTLSFPTVTPTGTGTCTITATKAADANYAEATSSVNVQIIAPTIAISSSPSPLPAGSAQVPYSASFSASGGTPTYTFVAAGLPPGLALASDGTLSGTPTAAGSFTFDVTATDANGFSVTTPFTLTIGAAFVQQRTREVIGNFIAQRADALTSNEPSRFKNRQRLNGTLFGANGGGNQVASGGQPGGPPVAFSATPDADGNVSRLAFGTSLKQMMAAKKSEAASSAAAAGASPEGRMALGASLANDPPPLASSPFDIWVEGYATHFEDDTTNSSGNVGILYAGADYQIMPGLLIGALMQFDFADETSGLLGSDVEGRGWLAGPYISARLNENIYFDARAAWGRSENDVSPFGTYTDRVDGDRWLARADLTGEWRWDRWRFSPTIGVAYFEEEIDSYVDSNGIFIAGQSHRLGRLNFGPEIGYGFLLADGTILEPMVSVQGLWDFEGADAITFNEIPGTTSDLRAKVQAGVTLTAPWGYTIRATGMIDGLGSDDYEAYGGQLMLNMPLN